MTLLTQLFDMRGSTPIARSGEELDTLAAVEILDTRYEALRTAYSRAYWLSTTDAEQRSWLDHGRRLRRLRRSIDEDDLEVVIAASTAMAAEHGRVISRIDTIVAQRF